MFFWGLMINDFDINCQFDDQFWLFPLSGRDKR